MKKDSLIFGVFDDEQLLLSCLSNMMANKVNVREVYSPFPIHGVDKILKIPETKIGIAAFFYGLLGCFLGVLMTYYMMILDWPQMIGGKPNASFLQNLPSFVPVIFELSIFCTAHLMVITFFIKNNIYPGKKADNPFKESTDDKFVVEIYYDKDIRIIKKILQDNGSIKIKVV